MKVTEFMRKTRDARGPIQMMAAELMERMSKEDFAELMKELELVSYMEQARHCTPAGEGRNMFGIAVKKYVENKA